jgi:hypothetical protein
VRENGGSPSATRPSLIRSKSRVLLIVLGVMAAMFVGGVAYRILHPPEEDKIVEELPVYPGARQADMPATSPTAWSKYGAGFADAVVLAYTLPSGTTRDDVLRYYGTHMPTSFRREGPSCWARGDSRVLLVLSQRQRPAVDVAVSTGGADCPGE